MDQGFEGMRRHCFRFSLFGAVVCAVLVCCAEGSARVNLEWRTASPVVRVGQVLEIGLYAVSDDASDQIVTGVQAIMVWDPNVLVFLGNVDNGPINWTESIFRDDSRIDGLNADCGPDLFCQPFTSLPFNDGDAFYSAFAFQFRPTASPSGTLVVTMRFRAESAAPATELVIPLATGAVSQTGVTGGETGTEVVTGELRSLTLITADCGERGDFSGDCVVNLFDYLLMSSCLTGPNETIVDLLCEPADMDGDGDADLRDLALFQRVFQGS